MKLLVVVLVVACIALWVLRDKRPREKRRPAAPPEKKQIGSEAMTPCAYCQVHVPESEAVRDDEGHGFCSEQHRRLGVARS